MPGMSPGYGREAFSFIEKLDRLSTTDEVMDSALEFVAGFGFETLLVSGLPSPWQRLEEVVLAKRYPNEWFKIYLEQEYIEVDPVIPHLKRSTRPFEWRELSYDSEQMPRAAEVMQRRKDFGFLNALIIPIHSPSNGTALVNMNRTKADLPAHHKPAIHLMALYLYDRICLLRVPAPERDTLLTLREREVLAWIAQGKSAWEIGEILNISERTVEAHAQSAFRKLGAVNRTHAVAIALRDRIISV